MTVTASGIALPAWNALYYVPATGTYRVASYVSGSINSTSGWILIAVYNADNASLRLGTGLTLLNGQTSTNGVVNNAQFNTSVNTAALTVTNNTATGTLGVTGNATVGGTLVVTGATTLNSTLTVGGVSKFNAPIIEGSASVKTFRNLATYTAGPTLGAIVIQTPVPMVGNYMTKTTIEGYMYDSTAPFSIDVSAYWNSTGGWNNGGYINVGSQKVLVRLAKNTATGNVVIILGDTTTTFQYPQLSVTSFTESWTAPNDAHGVGWTISQQTSLAAYDTFGIIPDKTAIPASQVTAGTFGAGTFNFQGAVGGVTTLTASGNVQASTLTSTVATGTAPLTVASTTKVTNLNADLLDGLDSTAFALATGSGSYIQNQNASPQAGANFNIAGNGTAATINATTGINTGAGRGHCASTVPVPSVTLLATARPLATLPSPAPALSARALVRSHLTEQPALPAAIALT